MPESVGVSSLLAIAIVRRLLLEREVPEGQDLIRLLGHRIEVWVSLPANDFNGRTPAQVLAAPRGDNIVRAWLRERLL